MTPPILYFAYGSNMDPVQMRRRCPSSRFVDIARLADHSLAFTRRSARRRSGVADVIASNGDAVWGIVYRILTSRDLEVLDRAEGYRPDRRRGNSYARETFSVELGAAIRRRASVQLYRARPMRTPPLPSDAYIGHLARGAAHWGLPAAYQAMLDSLPRSG